MNKKWQEDYILREPAAAKGRNNDHDHEVPIPMRSEDIVIGRC